MPLADGSVGPDGLSPGIRSACQHLTVGPPKSHPLTATLLFVVLCSACAGGAIQHPVAAGLPQRPLRLSPVRAGCPASPVRPVALTWGGVTGGISGYAAGGGPVELVLSEESTPIPQATIDGQEYVSRAVVHLGPSSVAGWGALKTTWLSLPAYQGAFMVRGRQLDGSGLVGIGEGPTSGRFLLEPNGPDGKLAVLNGGKGYRPAIGYVWLKKPGCYGFQIDGTSFSHTVTLRVIP